MLPLTDSRQPTADSRVASEALGPGAEFDLIRRFFREPQALPPEVTLGPGDDCAVIGGLALSTDMSVEGIHFRRDWLSPREIGYRAAAAALSDLAAVAARPLGVLVSLAAPPADAGENAVAVMDGVRAAAAAVGAALIGGDVTRSPGPLALDVTVVGACAEPVLRNGARPGDELWVTGELGAAALVVRRLLDDQPAPPEAWPRFAAPAPRTREALWLRERGVPRAMLDLSDGLAGDSGHLAAASGVAIVLDLARVPVHPAVRAGAGDPAAALWLALAGGEDYELCFAARPGAVPPLLPEFEREFGIGLARVGEVRAAEAAGPGVFIAGPEGGLRPFTLHGYQHFEAFE